jgi:DnaJ-class molecular chaperone
MVESYLTSPAYIAGIRTVLSAYLKEHMSCYFQNKNKDDLRDAVNGRWSDFKQKVDKMRVVPTAYKLQMSWTWNSIVSGVEVELDIVPIQGNCKECNGTGGDSYGHHDQGWADCRYCEGSGIQKWARCKECGKFGTVSAPEKGFLGEKDCPTCAGTKKLPLNFYATAPTSYDILD